MKPKNSRIKRLFLFAGYDKAGKIDNALLNYTKKLSQFGDIILVMDSDCTKTELSKLKNITLYATGARHGEYDFGSYKRAYIWATQNLDLTEYDYVYMVNDSVYGPLYPLDSYFTRMESLPCDAFGLVANPHRHHPHIQSWFIGMTPTVFLSRWYDQFMHQITKLPHKGEITRQYEQGFSKQITENNLSWCCLFNAPGRSVYNNVKKFYKIGMPFIKCVAFTRNHGALGRQISYILRNIDSDTRDAILSSARATYGENHIKWLITRNPIKIIFRNINHAFHKLFIEGI
ncbi:MAG: rhamnan synthesis F family protein [Alphaproteobacteria bacterium]|nr:rhamnan synthesis F family protein [Alphaproteobacteria bacterium]